MRGLCRRRNLALNRRCSERGKQKQIPHPVPQSRDRKEKARDSSRDDMRHFFGLQRRAAAPSRLVVYFCDVRNFVTSLAVGIEGWAPLRVTEMAATAEA